MAVRTITRLYDDHTAAVDAVHALEAEGIPTEDVSLVANNVDDRYASVGSTAKDASTDAGQAAITGTAGGASLGTVLGGGAGLLAGIGALAIPGVGPIVAAGWLVATLTGAGVGAAAGGLLGSLTGAGLSEADANVHAEGVRRGGNLVTVRADESRAASIEAILDGRKPVDVASRRAAYQGEGWTKYDAAAPAYTAEQVTTERKRRVVVVS